MQWICSPSLQMGYLISVSSASGEAIRAAASSSCRSMALFRRAFALLALSCATFEFLSLYSFFQRFNVGNQSALCMFQRLAGLPETKWRPQTRSLCKTFLYSLSPRLIAHLPFSPCCRQFLHLFTLIFNDRGNTKNSYTSFIAGFGSTTDYNK